MVIYTREEKVLIIPEGDGCGCQGGGQPTQRCEREKREAYESGYTAGLHADCGEAIDEAYNSGYTAGLEACSGSTDCSSAITEAYQSGYTEGYNQGQADCPECSGSTCNIQPLKSVMPQFDNYPVDYQMDIYPDEGYDGLGRVSIDKRQLYQQGYEAGLADCSGSTDCSSAITEAYQSGYTAGLADCSGSSCTLEEGRLDISDFWGGGPTVVYPFTADGFSQFTVEDTNGSYAHKHYMDGYNDGLAQCSGSTDCSSAITEAYESGVTEGMTEQKSLLVSSAFTRNGTYTRENGWNEIEVNVPQWLPAEEKTLSLVRNVPGPWEVLADNPVGMSKVTVEDNGYGSWKYDQGYQAGLEDCSGSSCNLTETWIDLMDGDDFEGQGVDYYASAITPNYDGWYKVHIQDKDYGQSKYNEGYADGQAACSGGTCNLEASQVTLGYDWTGFTRVYPSQGYDGLSDVIVADIGYGQRKYDEGYTDGHTSGYTEGYNAAITANCGSAITEAYESGTTNGYIVSSTKLAYFDQPAWVDTHNNTLFEEGDTLDMVFSFSGTHLQPNSNVIVHLFNNGSSANTLNKSVFAIDFEKDQLFIYMYSCDGNGWKWAPFSSYGSTFARYTGDTYHLIVRSYNNSFDEPSTQVILVNESRFSTYTGSTYNNSIHFSSGTTDSFRINCLYDEQNDTYSEMCSGLIVKSLKIYKQNGETNGNYHKTSLTTNMMWKDGKLLDTVTGEYNAYVYENGSAIVYSLPSIDDTLNILW